MSNVDLPSGPTETAAPIGALPARLWEIVTALRVVVAAWGGRDRASVPLVVLVWSRVGWIAQRFEALVARLVAGTLGPTRVRLSRRAGARSAYVRLPRRSSWLIGELQEVAVFGYRLQALMQDPAMAALLESCPRAGRILRPLRRMLDIDPKRKRVRAAPKPAPWWQAVPDGPPAPETAPYGTVLFPSGRPPPCWSG